VKILRPSQNYGDMYFKKENFSLYKVDGGLTGSLLDQKFNSDGAAPVIGYYTSAPFLYDFPAFPLEKNVTRTYGKIQQSVSVDTFTTEDGKTVESFKEVFGGVPQYWQPGAPWWIYEEKGDMVKAWLVDWGHEEVKKTLVNYIRTETPVFLFSTRTRGTKNYNIPISGTAVKIYT